MQNADNVTEYKVGDELVCPMHGAGVVESIEERDILGEKRYYYIMKMPVGGVKVMIPVDNTAGSGVRDVIPQNIADDAIDAFKRYPADVTSNWNKRYRENMEKMRSGNILEVSYVVKTLMLKERMKGLSMGEKKMLSGARQILISELVIAKQTTQELIELELENIVASELESMIEMQGEGA